METDTLLDIPDARNVVRVRLIDTTTKMTSKAQAFIEPLVPGHEWIEIPDMAFLIEHEATGQKVLFDLGTRKDYWNLPPVIQGRLGRGASVASLRVDKDITEILRENGIALADISSVVWSHYHWHHVGNVSLFPPSTSLFVGPGFSSSPNLVPGFPENPDSPISSADLANRRVCEVDFSISGLEIGGFRAFDFFSDGSFYLLDTPGHCIGHVCGLARTMAAPNQSTFVFMGGDIAHFGGTFRPSHNLPLPDEIPANVLDKDSAFPIPCPCNFFTDQHPQSSASPRSTPFYNISTDKSSAYIQPPTAQNSVNKLARMDASPRVLVCFAHDPATLRYLPTLNDSPELDLNDWKSQGWKEKCHWNWLNYLSRAGKSGRAPTYKGFWRDGRPWPEASEYLRERGAGAKGTGL